MSFTTQYDSLWNDIFKRRITLLNKRAELEAELSDVKVQLAHLSEIMNHLGPLAGVSEGENITTMGITDAVRWTISRSDERLSATEVRDKLVEKGYDLSTLSAPMASIYKILSRLASEAKPEITREKDSDGKVYYQWIKKESDIPF